MQWHKINTGTGEAARGFEIILTCTTYNGWSTCFTYVTVVETVPLKTTFVFYSHHAHYEPHYDHGWHAGLQGGHGWW